MSAIINISFIESPFIEHFIFTDFRRYLSLTRVFLSTLLQKKLSRIQTVGMIPKFHKHVFL